MEGLEMIDEHTVFDTRFHPDTEVQVNTRDSAPGMPAQLVTKLPTVGGMMTVEPTLLMHKFGCAIANTNWVVLCAAHLYAACQQTGLISQSSRWQDMDFFLERNRMFTDNVPDPDPWTMVAHYHLALGAQGRSLDKVKANCDNIIIKRPREITANSMLCQEWLHIVEARNSRGGVAIAVVDAMLEAFTKADCPDLNLQGKYSTPREIIYTPSQLLVVMKHRLIDDEPVRHFDMIGFSQRCSTFLAEARQRTGISPVASQNGTNLHSPDDFTHLVLVEAARASDAGVPVSRTLLFTVSKVLKNTMANGGDKYKKATYARSSGHLSSFEKPMFALIPFPTSGETSFRTFVRECLTKAENWMVEDDAPGAAIYQVNGDPENFTRLAKVYRVLNLWDQKCKDAGTHQTSMPTTDYVKLNKGLIRGMRRWADAGFHAEAMPPILTLLLAVNCEGATDDASFGRAGELLVRLVQSSE